jgi:hypothetical protein
MKAFYTLAAFIGALLFVAARAAGFQPLGEGLGFDRQGDRRVSRPSRK